LRLVVAVMAVAGAVLQVPFAVRYWPVSAHVTCTPTEFPVGSSDTRTHFAEKYAEVGLVTVPRTCVAPLVTSTSRTLRPRVTITAR
jgi:hypothetical protein